jgi:hypothetical protein
VLAIVAAAAVLGFTPTGSGVARARLFPLATIPSVGTVTWLCRPASATYAIALRLDRQSATTRVTLVGPNFNAARTLQPGDRLSFPFIRAGVERLAAVQGTEARTLRATVTATFARGRDYCFPYFPPRLSVRVGW